MFSLSYGHLVGNFGSGAQRCGGVEAAQLLILPEIRLPDSQKHDTIPVARTDLSQLQIE